MAFYVSAYDWILTLLVLGLGAGGYLLYKHLREWEMKIRDQLKALKTETKLSEIFSGNSTSENIYTLANNLFKTIKKQFSLEADSYSEMVSELKHAHMAQEMRDALIDFFDHMIIISYKDHNLPDEERDQLKSKLKLIMQKLQQ